MALSESYSILAEMSEIRRRYYSALAECDLAELRRAAVIDELRNAFDRLKEAEGRDGRPDPRKGAGTGRAW